MKDESKQKYKIWHETKYIVHIIYINFIFSIQSSVTNELKQNKEIEWLQLQKLERKYLKMWVDLR